LNIEFLSTVTAPLQAVAWFWAPASPQALSIDCLFGASGAASALPLAMKRVLVYILMPLAMLLALLALEVTLLKCARRSRARGQGMANRLFASGFVAAFFFLPSIARSLFSLFACVSIDEPASPPFVAEAVGSFWTLDLNMQCWAGYHRVFSLGLGVPLLLLGCVGLPACILYKTLSYRHMLDNPHVIKYYGFLFRAYKSRFCWWGCVIVLQTEVLVAISVFGHSIGPMYQALFANAMLALMTILLMMARPHAHAVAYRVMLHAMCCLALTSYIALSFIPSGTYKADRTYGILMGCVLVLLNGSFVMPVLWQIYKHIDWRDFASACRGFALGVGGLTARNMPWLADRCCCCVQPPGMPPGSGQVGLGGQQFGGQQRANANRPPQEQVPADVAMSITDKHLAAAPAGEP
jgi:hypothetical protein